MERERGRERGREGVGRRGEGRGEEDDEDEEEEDDEDDDDDVDEKMKKNEERGTTRSGLDALFGDVNQGAGDGDGVSQFVCKLVNGKEFSL